MTDDLNSDPNETGNENPNIKLLREKAARADALEAQLASNSRELAILKSGIDAENPLGKFFIESYKGDVSDVEALIAQAKELGVPLKGDKPAEPAPTGDGSPAGESGTPAEPTGTEERRTLSDGAPADSGIQANPVETALTSFQEEMKNGATWETAAGKALNLLANAAAAGDTRVIHASR